MRLVLDLTALADVISGTFGGEALSLAACQATLGVYQREPVVKHMWEVGLALQQGLRCVFRDHGLPYIVDGYPVHPRVRGDAHAGDNAVSLLIQEVTRRGILWHHAGVNVSYSHTMDDVMRTVDVFDGACRAIRDGATLKGAPIQPASKR